MRKELSVFDVQEALRQHRDYGHDVLSNPRQTIFEGTPYQTRVGTRLIIRNGDSPFAGNAISSLLMQSERPVISALSSSYHKTHSSPYSTTVSIGTPSVTIPHYPSDAKYNTSNYGSTFEFWGPGSSVESYAPKLYFFDDSDYLEKWPEAMAGTPHEALQNHVTSPFKTVGLHREPSGQDHFSYNLDHPKTLNDFKTPFNTQEALSKLVNSSFYTSTKIAPFSNVISVSQPGVNSIHESRHYIYLPETEQLHKVSGP